MGKVFTNLCQKGDFAVADDKNEAVKKYSKWLTEVFDETLSKIASIIASDKKQILKELCLTSMMKLIVKSHDPKEEKTWTSIDVKVYTIQSLARHPKKSDGLIFRQNLLRFLEILNYEKEEFNGESSLVVAKYEVPEESVAKNFNMLWQDFGKIQHKEVEMYKRLLILLTDKVLPVLKNPLGFTDFLMESYNVGGSISLLALNGVFFLITKHHLEYPDFYTKLYEICTPDLMHAKYRSRFFYLANIFMTSSHLPQYLVAAFVKRLSRLCLTAPADAILVVLPFIGNLLIRHKSLLKMLENTEDHYIMDEKDPQKSKALESGLWEIKSLQSHMLPQVSQAAKFINKNLPQMEWNIADYLDITAEDMFATEAKKKIFVNVPLTFERPQGCAFAKDDLLSNYFV